MRLLKPQAPSGTTVRPKVADRAAFTLVELLVVISIIVILLALLVGGLERALKAAERGKCSANQRAIAQSAAAYALEYERTFPIAQRYQNNAYATTALVVRTAPGVAAARDGTDQAFMHGIGHLISQGRVAGRAKAGEAVHCPSLDTTSAAPAKTGMDEVQASDGNAQPSASYQGASNFHVNTIIVSGYLYRAKSWAVTHSGGTIRTNIAKATFPITSDLVTYIGPAANQNKSGRMFHHIDGWMVSFGDGHAEYIRDPEGPFSPGAGGQDDWTGFVEREVATDKAGGTPRNIHGGVNAAAATDVNALATERVFKWFGAPTGGTGDY